MAINLSYTQVTETVGTTEWSFTTDTSGPDADTNAGVYQGFFDVSTLAAGDTFEIRVYEKVGGSGATQRRILQASLTGAQANPIFATPPLALGIGWDMCVVKIAGTDRSIVGRVARIS